jgi:sortase A
VRRALALSLCALGLYLCASGSYIYVKALVAQVLLRSAWAEARGGSERARPWPWADTWPVARLLSPAHGVDLIVLEGATGESTAFGPGHVIGTAEPGERGNVAIAAHRDTHFAFLEQVQAGDDLWLELPDGRARRFVVDGMSVVDQNDTASLSAGADRLTLVTCYPFHSAIPGGPLRYVVQARAALGPV